MDRLRIDLTAALWGNDFAVSHLPHVAHVFSLLSRLRGEDLGSSRKRRGTWDT